MWTPIASAPWSDYQLRANYSVGRALIGEKQFDQALEKFEKVLGSDVTTAGYVTESALSNSTCDSSGACTYVFRHAVPEKAIGTYAIGVEARRAEVLLPGTVTEMSVTYGAKNQAVVEPSEPSAKPLTPLSTSHASPKPRATDTELQRSWLAIGV